MTLWTIGIATLGQRRGTFARLLGGLMPQVDVAGGAVRVVACWDNGEMPLDAKRQALVEAAADSTYICFIDDDDTVSDDYVPSILEAMRSGPDYIGMWMQVYRRGRVHRRAELSLKHGGWFDGPTHYCRDITHENPMLVSIVSTVDFRDHAPGEPEDRPWADKLRGLVKTEVMIDRVLYHYWWDPARSAWGRRARITPTDPSGRPWRRLAVDSPHFSYLER